MKLWLIRWTDGQGVWFLTLYAETAEDAVQIHANVIDAERLQYVRWAVREIPDGEFQRFKAAPMFKVERAG